MSLFFNNYKKLVRENKYGLAEISGKNFKVLDSMFKYLRTFEVSLFELEVIKKDLIGLAKEAEAEGVFLLDKLGTTEKEFCDSLAKDGLKPGYMEQIVPLVKAVIIMFFIGYTILWSFEGKPETYGFPGSLIIIGVVAWIYDFLIIRNLERKRAAYSFSTGDKYKRKLYRFLVFLALLILFIWELPEGMSFTIHGNGRVIFFILLILSVISFLGNNYYWDKLSEKYNWK
ncbi:hypothetical protein C818_01519 [Lachnospiraceae bacterium MD308]|jgi:Uncharacterized protein conserved in bacteria|nr:hypothetical protein C818_01519 [Lachnospiraceae bacterium MD308]